MDPGLLPCEPSQYFRPRGLDTVHPNRYSFWKQTYSGPNKRKSQTGNSHLTRCVIKGGDSDRDESTQLQNGHDEQKSVFRRVSLKKIRRKFGERAVSKRSSCEGKKNPRMPERWQLVFPLFFEALTAKKVFGVKRTISDVKMGSSRKGAKA
jgi:hypothetical protein